ncbi:uncharacterized protein [Amphiura filiformis]|uniref:uncharacterized protein isoform X2 n=1 Tax=Amphiura filiformis TaxID=82378 RepID=UPI003B212674
MLRKYIHCTDPQRQKPVRTVVLYCLQLHSRTSMLELTFMIHRYYISNCKLPTVASEDYSLELLAASLQDMYARIDFHDILIH